MSCFRGYQLINLDKHDLAAAEFRKVLANDPDDSDAYSGLGLALALLGRHAEAFEAAKAAVRLDPDSDSTHYALANVLDHGERIDEALDVIAEAIRLDPDDPHNHALQASLLYQKGRWADALAAAERGLALNPEHNRCVNTRAMALVKLGRRGEAVHSIRSALERDPLNDQTHANMGWAMLEDGQRDAALEHFREALRIDPHNGWAQQGIVEAMKARSRVYAVILRFLLWSGRQSLTAQLIAAGAVIVLWKALRTVGETKPELAWLTFPVLAVIAGAWLLLFLGDMLFLMLLRFRPEGRLVLTPSQITMANWTAVLFFASAGLIVASILTGLKEVRLAAWQAALAIAMLQSIDRETIPWRRQRLARWTLAASAIGVIGLVTFQIQPIGRWIFYSYLGVIAVVAMFPEWLLRRPPKV